MIFYSYSDDCESLSHECEEEALAEWLENVDNLREECPVEIYKYETKQIDTSVIENISSLIEEHVLEVWDENYGDPSSFKYQTMSKSEDNDIKNEINSSVNRIMDILGPPWICELKGTLTFTYEEVLSLMKDEIDDYERIN